MLKPKTYLLALFIAGSFFSSCNPGNTSESVKETTINLTGSAWKPEDENSVIDLIVFRDSSNCHLLIRNENDLKMEQGSWKSIDVDEVQITRASGKHQFKLNSTSMVMNDGEVFIRQ